jgi:hypothetical protein
MSIYYKKCNFFDFPRKKFGLIVILIKFFIPYYNNFELSSLASVSKKFQDNYFHRNRINTKKIYFKEKYIICKKLDNKNLNFQFIKIDAEGSELQIIRGGTEI